jgi:hypothetical protein
MPCTLFARSGFLVAGLVSSLLLTGCVTSNRTALAPTTVSRLKAVDVTTSIAQPEIAADVDPSNIAAITGGGLIGALIDVAVEANRSKKAEVTITPLRDALIEFNSGEVLRTNVSDKLQVEPLLPIRKVLITGPVKEKAVIEQVKKGDADAVLLVSVDYRLAPAFDRVRVLAHVVLFDKETLAQGGKPVYQNDFATYRALATPPKDRAEAIKVWCENHGTPMRDALATSFAELVEMIRFDLRQGEEANMVPKAAWTNGAPMAGRMAVAMGPAITGRGSIAKRTDDRTWVRLSTGELSSTN